MGWAAYLEQAAIRRWLRVTASPFPFEHATLWALLSAAGGAAVIIGSSQLPVRFSFTVAGVVLLMLALFSERAAWQLALTVTAGAFLLYVGKFFTQNHPGTHPALATSVALAVTLVFSVSIARRHTSGQEMITWNFQTLLWTAVAAGLAHGFWHVTIPPALTIVLVTFVALAVVVTGLVFRRRKAEA